MEIGDRVIVVDISHPKHHYWCIGKDSVESAVGKSFLIRDITDTADETGATIYVYKLEGSPFWWPEYMLESIVGFWTDRLEAEKELEQLRDKYVA